MKPKQLKLKICLRTILILLMVGTLCTLVSVIVYYPWTPSVPNEMFYTLNYAYGNNRGFPFTWISYWAVSINAYSPIPQLNEPPPQVETFGSWTLYTLNFIEDILLYSLFTFLLLVYLDWRKKREYANKFFFSRRLLLENMNNRDLV